MSSSIKVKLPQEIRFRMMTIVGAIDIITTEVKTGSSSRTTAGH
ncbi:MAG: hypothetical protein PHH26_04540 [Candidatus Thermoplasmatota archaeon]|nr:hypothetical protein [Candidatus Thermoplasmatota archaeon]